jgi:hypothetical protein
MASTIAEILTTSKHVQNGSMQSISTAELLESRQQAVKTGQHKLIPEEQSWKFLKASGRNV